jgi:hypothetical protein
MCAFSLHFNLFCFNTFRFMRSWLRDAPLQHSSLSKKKNQILSSSAWQCYTAPLQHQCTSQSASVLDSVTLTGQILLQGPEITVPFMLITTALIVSLLGQPGITMAIGYISMGLCYQFVHYAVHTRAVPKTKLFKLVRQNHMQHHCRNENYWLSFTCPAFDEWCVSCLLLCLFHAFNTLSSAACLPA